METSNLFFLSAARPRLCPRLHSPPALPLAPLVVFDGPHHPSNRSRLTPRTSPMSSPTRFTHRRRSHSASSPIPRRQPDDVKWRISAKRSRPPSIRTASYRDLATGQPAEKWDVDRWRRAKRARRDSHVRPALFPHSLMSSRAKPLSWSVSGGGALVRRAWSQPHGRASGSGILCGTTLRAYPVRCGPLPVHLGRIPVLLAQRASPHAPAQTPAAGPSEGGERRGRRRQAQ